MTTNRADETTLEIDLDRSTRSRLDACADDRNSSPYSSVLFSSPLSGGGAISSKHSSSHPRWSTGQTEVTVLMTLDDFCFERYTSILSY